MADIDNYVKLMLHGDGVDNGTTFTDSSSVNRSITYSNATTKTDVKKFGTASIRIASSGYLNFGTSADWNFGSSPFTVDFWIYRNRQNVQEAFANTWAAPSDTDNWHLGVLDSNTIFWFPRGTGGGILLSTNPLLQAGWHHIAIVSDGSFCRLFLDGNLEASGAIVAGSNSDHNVVFGVSSVDMLSQPFYGYVDELRVSKGVARWTSNFIPATSAYQGIIYSIAGYVSEDSKIVVYNNSNDSLLTSSVKYVGNYTIDDLPNQNKVNVVAIPTNSGIAPKVEVGITPISSE